VKIIRDKHNNFITNILSRKIEKIHRSDNIMRNTHYYLLKIEDRFFLEESGNVSPYNRGSRYIEISEEESEILSKLDCDTFHKNAFQTYCDYS
jgi:hypothetical protein